MLEYMNAGSLADALKVVNTMREPQLACIAKQVLQGLQYLHKERRIIHRDIKPSNILLNEEGECKIADFGVSGQLESSIDAKLSFVGTVTYMSPERIQGHSHSFDSDIWSFGLTLMECAIGFFPYIKPAAPAAEAGTTTRRPSFSFWDIMARFSLCSLFRGQCAYVFPLFLSLSCFVCLSVVAYRT